MLREGPKVLIFMLTGGPYVCLRMLREWPRKVLIEQIKPIFHLAKLARCVFSACRLAVH